MAKPPSPNVYMLLPDGASRDALRAGVLALQCVPVNLPQNATERHALLSRLTIVDRVFVFVDISTGTGSGINARTGGIDDVMNSMSLPLRARTVLTRLASGHVSQAERACFGTSATRPMLRTAGLRCKRRCRRDEVDYARPIGFHPPRAPECPKVRSKPAGPVMHARRPLHQKMCCLCAWLNQ